MGDPLSLFAHITRLTVEEHHLIGTNSS